MKAKDILINNRYCSNHFNKGEYPILFERIKGELEELFAETEGGIEAAVDEILAEVEANMDSQRFGFLKKSVFADDHIVLSLFVAPAAAKIGTPQATAFAETLASKWVERYPESTFKVGDYDAIMDGFKWKLTIFSK